ncbi:MAG: MaoC family dehydratase, partial [Pseudomonadota bacterium]|nr:MaoC family dehydratase [Pseudomonadota bacterium]
ESVSPETMKVWAPILRDPNPIHLDREVVKAKGLGERLINQGPINVAYVMDMLMRNFPQGRIVSMTNRFVDNVYEDDAVEATATVTGVEQAGDETRVSCDFALKADERSVVISGTAVVAVPNT